MGCLDKLTKLNDICLFVDDFWGSLKYYTEKFGFKVIRLQPDPENANYVQFDFEGTAVTMWQKDGVIAAMGDGHLGEYGHHFMLAVKVPELSDVDEIYETLTANGVVCIQQPTTYEFGSRAAYFLDYEKNIWEVFAWEEGNGPGLLSEQE